MVGSMYVKRENQQSEKLSKRKEGDQCPLVPKHYGFGVTQSRDAIGGLRWSHWISDPLFIASFIV